MKLLKSKKASEMITELGPFLVFSVFLGIISVILYSICNININQVSRILPDLEDEVILASRFYNSENCFAYQDSVGRVHTKIIDQNKFTNGNLNNNCFKGPSDVKYAFKLSLRQDFEGIGPVLDFGSVETFNWVSGGISNKEIIENTPFLYNGILYNGELKIEVKNVG